jgi:glycosyltransferase involved in cell wall biosynthesis
MNHSCIGVVATSARVEAQFRDLLGYKGPVTIVPNGADTSLGRESVIEREAVRRELGLSPGIRAFVSVGRICEQKNQLGLVEAFAAAFPDSEAVRLVLVGGVTQDRGHLESGRAYEARLERKIRELRMESRVIRTGWREDVPRLLSGGDVYVQASLWEGSPLAVVEAMAAGLPVVMADNGGVLPEFRDSVHGWVVRAGDVASLSVALRQAGTMNTYGLSAAGRKSQELACARYDAQIVAKQFYNWATKFLRLA